MNKNLDVYEDKKWEGNVSPACTAPFVNLYINFPKRTIKMCCMASHAYTFNLNYNLGDQIKNFWNKSVVPDRKLLLENR